MKKLIDFLTSKINFILFIYVVLQLILIFSLNLNYGNDAQYYYKLAQDCIRLDEFYPAQVHYYEDYIVAPLYINILIILLKIYNSTISISILNLLIVLLQIYLLYKISLHLFSKSVARLTVLLFLFYFNTMALILQNYSELIFLLLISASIYFYLHKNSVSRVLSGIFLGASIAVRPLGWALLATFVLLHIYKIIKTKKPELTYSYIYLGTFVFIFSFGTFINSHFGKFEYSSTTGPINLLLGANDDATGAFNSTVLEYSKAGYLEHPDTMTYLQKGKFYQEKAISWITEHPFKWILLAPMKLFYAYGWDDVSLSNLLGFGDTNFLHVIRILLTEGDFNKALPHSSTFEKFSYFFILLVSHLFYYFLLFLIVLETYKLFKQKLLTADISLILLFSFFASLMIMVTVGTPRYKYPMFILLLPFAAYCLHVKFKLND